MHIKRITVIEVLRQALTDRGGSADEGRIDRGRGEAADDARRFNSVAAHLAPVVEGGDTRKKGETRGKRRQSTDNRRPKRDKRQDTKDMGQQKKGEEKIQETRDM